MNEKEALARVKTGNFNGGFGFDMQLLVNAVGIAGEMFKNGQIVEVVRCKNCIYRGKSEKCFLAAISEEKNVSLFMLDNHGEWFCADGKHKED